MSGDVADLDFTEASCIRYHWPEKFIVITCNIHYSGVTHAVNEDATNNIGVRLLPLHTILLDLPCINDITYEI
jgi:hypothetical protein